MSNSCELHENVGMRVTYVNAVISSGEIRILAQTSSIYVTGFMKTIPSAQEMKSNLLLIIKPTLLHYLEIPRT